MADHCPVCDAMIIGNEACCRQCALPLVSSLPPTSTRMRSMQAARSFVLINPVLAIGPMAMLVDWPLAVLGASLLLVLGVAMLLLARSATYPAAFKLGLTQAAIPLLWLPCSLATSYNPALACLGVLDCHPEHPDLFPGQPARVAPPPGPRPALPVRPLRLLADRAESAALPGVRRVVRPRPAGVVDGRF